MPTERIAMTASLWTIPASRIHPLLSGVALILGGILAVGAAEPQTPSAGVDQAQANTVSDENPFRLVAPSGDQASTTEASATDDEPPGPPYATLDLQPVRMAAESATYKLPAVCEDVVAGAGGRFLIFHFPTLGKLGVFDVVAARITGFVSLTSGDVGYAAGAEKLIVVLRDQKVIQRWNLKTLEREVAVPVPDGEVVSSVTMGCAADGPVLLGTQDARYSATNLRLLDPNAMQLIPHQISTTWIRESPSLGHLVRASADGRVFAAWRETSSPTGFITFVLQGDRVQSYYEHESLGYLRPNFDGSLIYTYGGLYSYEGKPVGTPQPAGHPIPAVQGNYYVVLPREDFTSSRPKKPEGIGVYVDGDSRPLLTLPDVLVEIGSRSSRTRPQIDKAVWFIPDAHLLVTIPPSRDMLSLRRINLEQALDKSEVDYLFVASRPPRTAKPGSGYQYRLTVKSKRGDARFQVASGPTGMTISPEGQLDWTVPADFARVEETVVVSVKDASGQEIFHTFRIALPDVAESQQRKTAEETRKTAEETARRNAEAAVAGARTRQEALLRAASGAPGIPTSPRPPAVDPETLAQQAQQARQRAETAFQQTAAASSQFRSNLPPLVRTWTDSEGNAVEARLAEHFGGVAYLRKESSNETLMVPVGRLSAEDQRCLTEFSQRRRAQQETLRRAQEQLARGQFEPPLVLAGLGAALQRYHDAVRQFPSPHPQNSTGRSQLSWRVQLLPYLGAKELFALFRHDEPFDSEHNRQLVPSMPAYFRVPNSEPGEGRTNYLAVTGPDTAWSGPRPSMAQVVDGSSNTIAVVEASDQRAVIWTQPEDYAFDPADPVIGLGNSPREGFYALTVDGRVRLLSAASYSSEEFLRMFRRNDGQELRWKE
jgi:hypothetical protein